MAGIDQYTVFCSHFDGTDAQTSATDSATAGSAPHTINFVGTAQLDTAQKVFGTSSLLLDGNSDNVYMADNADWDFGSGNFVIDFRVRYSTVNTGGLYSQDIDAQTYAIMYRATGDTSLHSQSYISLVLQYGLYTSWTPSADTWYHVALVRSGSNWYHFIGGTQIGSTLSDSTDYPNLAATFNIGMAGATGYLNGWIDEFRVSKGTDRGWTSNFSIPTEAYSAVTATARSQAIII